MATPLDIQLGLDDLLADLHYARRNKELGRLALLAYCEVRGWARQAGMPDVAQGAAKLFTENPCDCKEEFLAKIDNLITTLEWRQQAYQKARQQFASPSESVKNHSISLTQEYQRASL